MSDRMASAGVAIDVILIRELRFYRRWSLKQAAAVVIAVTALFFYVSSAPVAAQPEPTEVTPQDGSVLAEPPEVVLMCFSERPLHDETDDFLFNVLDPQDRRMGLRIVFQPLSNCVAVYPGLPDEPPFGQWTLEWEIIGEESGEAASGIVQYEVALGGSPAPAISPVVPEARTPDATETPADATPESEGVDEDDGGLDAAWIAAIAAGLRLSLGALALVAILLLLRRRGHGGGQPPPSA
jgi:methionine-rich copper-binding protein CopC